MSAAKVPVNLLTGFLGVGKTTAVRRLLADKPADQFWAVLVNEFGEVGIDGAAIEASADGLDVVEVPGGCICCTTSPMLRVSITRLLRARRPDRLLIEPSGLGHPAGIVDVLRDPFLAAALELRAVVTLVDPRHLDDARYTLNDTWRDQIALADVLVANKCDRADAVQVDRFMRMAAGLYPPKLAVVTTTGGVFDGGLLDLVGETIDRTPRTTSLSPSPPGRGVGVRERRLKARLPDETIAFARELREHTTDAEHLLWQLLRDRRLLNIKFRRQHPWPPYTLDFYCQDAKLVIELDGGQHDDPTARSKDAERTRRLESAGFEVLRFWNNEALTQTEAVVEQIHARLLARLPAVQNGTAPPHPQPFSRGEKGARPFVHADNHIGTQSSRGWHWLPEQRFSAERLALLFQRLDRHADLALPTIQRAKGVFHTDHGWLLFNWVDGEASAIEIAWRRDSRGEVIVAGASPEWTAFEDALADCLLAG